MRRGREEDGEGDDRETEADDISIELLFPHNNNYYCFCYSVLQ